MLSLVWQSLSVPSSSSIKCFSVQFSTWSNLSDKLISSICSCSHLFCSCLSSCFSLDCFLFRPAAKLSSGTSLSWHSENFFHFRWVPVFWTLCLPLVYSFILVSSTITVKVCIGNFFFFIYFYPHARLFGCWEISILEIIFPQKFGGVPILPGFQCWCWEIWSPKKLSFFHNLGNFNPFIEFLNFNSLLKQLFYELLFLVPVL